MGVTGIRVAASHELEAKDVAKGVRTCLTVGLALACDAVFHDGRGAFVRIEELTASIGAEDTLVILRDTPGRIGELKPECSCALDSLDTEKLRMMVFQFQMFRMMQHAMIEAAD
jgi:hypothetical protein